MKNYQKNPIFPSIQVSCMLNKLTCCLVQKDDKHYLRSQMSLNFESLVQDSSNPSGCSYISPTHSFYQVMIMHHIVHCIDCVSSLFVGICPLSLDDVPTMSSMTPIKSYTIFRSARKAKPPCSFRYNPTLLLLLSFTTIHLLLAAVVEPLYPLHDLSLPQ